MDCLAHGILDVYSCNNGAWMYWEWQWMVLTWASLKRKGISPCPTLYLNRKGQKKTNKHFLRQSVSLPVSIGRCSLVSECHTDVINQLVNRQWRWRREEVKRKSDRVCLSLFFLPLSLQHNKMRRRNSKRQQTTISSHHFSSGTGAMSNAMSLSTRTRSDEDSPLI